MELTKQEIADLASFLAKRFPSYRHRGNLADVANLPFSEDREGDAESAWMCMLKQSLERESFYTLIVACARCDLADDNLQQVCSVILERRPTFYGWRRLAVKSGLSLGLGMTAAAGLCLWLLPANTTVESAASQIATKVMIIDRDGTTVTQPAVAVPDPPSVIVQALHHDPTADDDTDSTTTSREKRDPMAMVSVHGGGGRDSVAKRSKPRAAVAAPEAAPITPATDHGRCTVNEGGLVGFWYAGVELPGQSGDTITMVNSVFVRADYPDRHNGFNARATARCVLKAGDRVRISQAPVLVPGARYWIPLVSGDLVQEGIQEESG